MEVTISVWDSQYYKSHFKGTVKVCIILIVEYDKTVIFSDYDMVIMTMVNVPC